MAPGVWLAPGSVVVGDVILGRVTGSVVSTIHHPVVDGRKLIENIKQTKDRQNPSDDDTNHVRLDLMTSLALMMN